MLIKKIAFLLLALLSMLHPGHLFCMDFNIEDLDLDTGFSEDLFKNFLAPEFDYEINSLPLTIAGISYPFPLEPLDHITTTDTINPRCDQKKDPCPISSHDSDKKQFNCPACNRPLSNKKSLKQHLQHSCPQRKTIPSFKCDVAGCMKRYSNPNNLKKHMKNHVTSQPESPTKTRETSQKITCPDCDKKISAKTHLLRHILFSCSARENTCEFACSFQWCSKTFKNPYRLVRHTKQSHNASPQHYLCAYGCTKTFAKINILSQHMFSICHLRPKKRQQ